MQNIFLLLIPGSEILHALLSRTFSKPFFCNLRIKASFFPQTGSPSSPMTNRIFFSPSNRHFPGRKNTSDERILIGWNFILKARGALKMFPFPLLPFSFIAFAFCLYIWLLLSSVGDLKFSCPVAQVNFSTGPGLFKGKKGFCLLMGNRIRVQG